MVERTCLFSLVLLLVSVAGNTLSADHPITFLPPQPGLGDSFDTMVDTRPVAACKAGSLPAARCLPIEDFLGPTRRLANVSGLLWLLGTAGLGGNEHVLVIGDNDARRDFVAGLLYLASQQQVSVLTARVTANKSFKLSPGIPRSKIREVIYRSPMRAHRLVLRNELIRLLSQDHPPVLLDGRKENEYWGTRIRSARGGHLPGAQHLPSASLKAIPSGSLAFPGEAGEAGDPVAYGHNEFEGLVYLARLTAQGIAARVYLEGWSGWAADGSLPVDSAAYPDWSFPPDKRPQTRVSKASPGISTPGIVAMSGGFALGGFWLGRITRNSRSA